MSFKHRSRRRCTGFTIIEMLFAMGIVLLMVLAITALSIYSSRNFVAISNYVELDDKNRLAMDTLTADIRQALVVISANSNRIDLLALDPVNPSLTGTNTYLYLPDAGTLVRRERFPNRFRDKVLLTGCDQLQFNVGQRNFDTNSVPFRGLPLNSSDSIIRKTAKVIDVSWVCSRRILGIRANTESVQTARVVIRNQEY